MRNGSVAGVTDDRRAAHLAAAVDACDDAILRLDADGRVDEANRAALRLFGLAEAQLVGTLLGDLVAEHDRDAWASALARGQAANAELSVRRRSAVLPTRLTLTTVPGEPPSLTAVLRDVEEQVLAQATLAESAQRIAESEALAHVGSWAWDAGSDAVQWSEELHRIHGLGPLDFDGTLAGQLARVHADDRGQVRQALADALGERAALASEFRVVRPDGEIRWVHARAAVVAGPGGEGLGLRGIYQDVTERHDSAQVLEDANERLTHLALYDGLTGLPNRSLLVDRLRTSLTRAQRLGHRVDVLYLDVDDFKTINDSRGHHTGDELLAALAQRLKEAVRATDTVAVAAPPTLARLHGDEFVVVLDDCDDLTAVTSRIESLLKIPLQLDEDGEVFVSVSIGTATAYAPTAEDSPEAMLAAANMAMHEAKRTGKARHVAFEPRMHETTLLRHELGDELHRAIQNGEFELAYQPVVTLHDRRVVGAEALVRWRHPQRGMVPPDVFIERAEETGLILPLGQWVLGEACRTAAAWIRGGHPEFTIAVNVSGRQLRDKGFVDMVRATLAETGVRPDLLCLEMTETTLMERDDEAIALLAHLREDGVHLAIDDFGTGYSSLGSLRRLPVDLLKIDRSFVASLPEDNDAGTIAWAVVRLGHTLGLPVLAEGVERPEQHEALLRFGCDQAQGYLYGRPMPQGDFDDLLRVQDTADGVATA